MSGTDRQKWAAGSGNALVVHPDLRQGGQQRRSPEACLDEAVGLVAAIGLRVADARVIPLTRVRPATLLGQGRIEELSTTVAADEIEVVVIDGQLSPVQQRNLERALSCKVIDRTGLILEIFADRARTREGRLQVELAQLTYQRSRLVRSWTHLERQRGGLGTVGGPGETQIEADRRMIDERVVLLRRQLDDVIRTRSLHRRNRAAVPYPIVALVGYTNAGKSTLFNRLTNAEVFAHDQLFATLDPTMRVLVLPSGRRVILSDTVGFISELPTHLVAAFRATLEEVQDADLLLHVRDISHADSDVQRQDVLDVLGSLGIDVENEESCIEVWNKTDLIESEELKNLQRRGTRGLVGAPVSALSGDGIEALLALVDKAFDRHTVICSVQVPVQDGETQAWLHRRGQVIGQEADDDQMRLRVRLEQADLGRLRKRLGAAAVHEEAVHEEAVHEESDATARQDDIVAVQPPDVDEVAAAS